MLLVFITPREFWFFFDYSFRHLFPVLLFQHCVLFNKGRQVFRSKREHPTPPLAPPPPTPSPSSPSFWQLSISFSCARGLDVENGSRDQHTLSDAKEKRVFSLWVCARAPVRFLSWLNLFRPDADGERDAARCARAERERERRRKRRLSFQGIQLISLIEV